MNHDGPTGTIFGNSYSPKARIKYSNSFGPVKFGLAYVNPAIPAVFIPGIRF